MKDELYLKKIRAEYEYLKAEEQYQKKIFDKAVDEFDGFFGEKINANKPSATKQEKKWKQKKNKIKSVDKLKPFKDYYFYENKIQEDDMEQWCFKAAWIGRSQGNYKCHPEFLYERTQTIEDDKDIVYEYIKEITAKMGISSGV